MAITVHLPPRSSLFHVYWPRLTPGYTVRSTSTSPHVATSHFARVHKGCPVSVSTHGRPGSPWVGKYATLSQGHRGLHRHKRTFISGASHASSRGTRREGGTQHYLTCVRVSFVHANSRLQNVYVRVYVSASECICVCPAGEFASKYEGAVPGGCVHECAWCLFNAVYLTLAAARWKVVLIFNEVTRPGITSQLLYSGRYMYIGTSEESERIE